MTDCISNMNKGSSNALFATGLLSTNMSPNELNQRRSLLFYYICIPLRILLYIGLLFFRNFNYKIVIKTVMLLKLY